MKNEAIEDYLKTMFQLETEHGKVSTTALAKRLEIAPASATGMIKKLTGLGFLTYKPYGGVTLTWKGKKAALEVIRHHRLIESFLFNTLKLPWDRIHQEAEKLEHVISEDLEERIDQFLGSPKTDPHGAPIPTKNGKVDFKENTLLSDLKAGDSCTIIEVSDQDAELLRYLGNRNLFPGTKLTVLSVEPFDGPLTIHTGEMTSILGRKAASRIFVQIEKRENKAE